MAYPPQPGGPGQPGPYGGQQGPQQAAGHPRQGAPHGGYQQYAYPQQVPPPQGGSYGGPPKKTGLVVGLSIGGVAVLATFFVTAFAAPGFLLSDGPEEVADNYAQAVSSQDFGQLTQYVCPSSELRKSLDEADLRTQDRSYTTTFTITGDATESGNRARVPIRSEVTFSGETYTSQGHLVLEDEDGWCVAEVDTEGADSGGSDTPTGEPAYPTGGYDEGYPTGGYGDYGEYDSYPSEDYGYDDDYDY
ncbi:hypothetical protein FHS23_000902 [Prauserella isguenensis]|uniref:DUF4878 domain-containing protein n=1 Tax=Prauserella isguenensis TaxID=1470180 RepID=A0A839RZI3_9PSEU|nr:hypothetical protein [Prauserella isguenensis]MBB3049907.1 hypothetical protein [Prauserella isguenensis]